MGEPGGASLRSRRRVVLDIGAGDGSISENLALSQTDGYVIALEPNPVRFALALKRLKRFKNVELLNKGLAEWECRTSVDEAFLFFPDVWMLDSFGLGEYRAAYSSLKAGGRITIITECVSSLAAGFAGCFQKPVRPMEAAGFNVDCQEAGIEEALRQVPQIACSPVFKCLFSETSDILAGLHWVVSRVRENNRLGIIRATKD